MCSNATRRRSWPTSRRATCPARRPARSISSSMTPPRWRWRAPGPKPPGPPSARPGGAGEPAPADLPARPERRRPGHAAGPDRRAGDARERAGGRHEPPAGEIMSRLLASLDAPPSGRARPVWFDAAAYGQARLLSGGDVPWPSPAELSSFFAKIGGMFHSDAILVDLADLFAQRTNADQQLRAAMAARSRPGYALRTLLSDGQARGTAAEAVRVLAATSGPVPLVLTVPTPGRWLVAAAQQAQRDGPDPGPPDAAQAETAAIYSADFLRMFAGTGVDGLLLDEGRA